MGLVSASTAFPVAFPRHRRASTCSIPTMELLAVSRWSRAENGRLRPLSWRGSRYVSGIMYGSGDGARPRLFRTIHVRGHWHLPRPPPGGAFPVPSPAPKSGPPASTPMTMAHLSPVVAAAPNRRPPRPSALVTAETGRRGSTSRRNLAPRAGVSIVAAIPRPALKPFRCASVALALPLVLAAPLVLADDLLAERRARPMVGPHLAESRIRPPPESCCVALPTNLVLESGPLQTCRHHHSARQLAAPRRGPGRRARRAPCSTSAGGRPPITAVTKARPDRPESTRFPSTPPKREPRDDSGRRPENSSGNR